MAMDERVCDSRLILLRRVSPQEEQGVTKMMLEVNWKIAAADLLLCLGLKVKSLHGQTQSPGQPLAVLCETFGPT